VKHILCFSPFSTHITGTTIIVLRCFNVNTFFFSVKFFAFSVSESYLKFFCLRSELKPIRATLSSIKSHTFPSRFCCS